MTCADCGIPVERRARFGPWPKRCPPCHAAYQKEWFREWNQRARDEKRTWFHRHPEAKLRHRLKHQGLTIEAANKLLEEQGRKCPLCEKPLTLATADVDHDHRCCPDLSCGSCVRGLLCHTCNLALGHLEKKPSYWVERALRWIR